jgi:hypothetical protein
VLVFAQADVLQLPEGRAFYWCADHIHGLRLGQWKYNMSIRDNWVELYNMTEDRYE